jgi:carotenoid cleavage dioxygenase
LTSRYIVVIQKSQNVDVVSVLGEEAKWLLTGEYGRINPFPWQPDRHTLIHLIDRKTGDKMEFETDPIMFFHMVNSFEQEPGIIISDVICYDEELVGDGSFNDGLTGPLHELESVHQVPTGGRIRRFRLDVSTGRCTWEDWKSDIRVELPCINRNVAARKHQYSYCIQTKNGRPLLVKLDHASGTTLTWQGQDLERELPHQPVFIPSTTSDGAVSEDDGSLVCLVRNQVTSETSCVVLDAASMREVARLHFPKRHHIPYNGHGTWLPDAVSV